MDIKKGESTLNIMLISIIIVIVVSIVIDSVKKNEININNLGKLNKNNENQQEILLSKGDISLKEEESIRIEIQKLQEILNNKRRSALYVMWTASYYLKYFSRTISTGISSPVQI